mgnify:CR=1 FL=1
MPFIGNQPTAVPLTSADLEDNIITSAKIADGTIVGADINTTFDLTGKTVTGAGGITEADQWRLTADITNNVDPIASNLERVDNTGFGYIGTGMSVTSGTWTFPSTGIYLIKVIATLATQSGDNSQVQIKVTTNNSSYEQVALADEGENSSLASSASCEFLFDVTDTANCKVRFLVTSLNAGSVIEGDTNFNRTSFTFIRLGDT